MLGKSEVAEPVVDGRAVQPRGDDIREIREPATGELLGHLRPADAATIDAAVDAARRTLDGAWRRIAPLDRSSLLHSLADRLESDQDSLAELEARNVGKAITSVQGEVTHAINTFRYFAAAVATINGRSSQLGGSMMFHSLAEPVGVVAQIVPWNYPLLMTAWKLAPALAAGCTTVLKPDPLTPLTALRVAEMAHEAGFPPGAVNVVPADGPTVGAHLVRHRGVDKIAFTGSSATGSEIMRLAADPVKRLSLELGGKSPTIVFADADLDEAVAGAAWGAFSCAGQSCEARSRILVESTIADEFTERFVQLAAGLRVGDPLDSETSVGSLISVAHREKVHGFVDRARSDGARALLGGEIPGGAGAFYRPTVIDAAAHTSEIAQEEVFGPVASIHRFNDEAEALGLANDTRYGLMATVWTTDLGRAHRISSRTRAGTIAVNHPYTSFPGVPFGGYRQSGFGREFSVETLGEYLETKSVLTWTSPRPASPPRFRG